MANVQSETMPLAPLRDRVYVRPMKIAVVIVVLLGFLLGAGEARAAACTSQMSGNWSSAGTWSNCDADGVPDADDSAQVSRVPHRLGRFGAGGDVR